MWMIRAAVRERWITRSVLQIIKVEYTTDMGRAFDLLHSPLFSSLRGSGTCWQEEPSKR